MKKQAIVDIERLYYAIATINDDGTITYSAPKKLYDVQKIALSIKTSSDKNYTTDGEDIVGNFEGGTITINTYGIDNATLNELEGHEVDSNGVTVENTNDDPPYIAIGFESKKRNGESRFIWIYLCKKQLDSEEYEVKKGKTEPKEATSTFEISQKKDGNWRAKVDTDDKDVPSNLSQKWFEKVYDGSMAA